MEPLETSADDEVGPLGCVASPTVLDSYRGLLLTQKLSSVVPTLDVFLDYENLLCESPVSLLLQEQLVFIL